MVDYHVIPRHNPSDPQADKKFYGIIKSSGRVTVRQLAEEIAYASSLTKGDVINVIESLLEMIPKELSRGNIVDLGALGNFKLTINTEGVPDELSFNRSHIKKINVNFSAGKEFKQAVENIELEKVAYNPDSNS